MVHVHLGGFLDRLVLGCDARQLRHESLKPPSGSGCRTIPLSRSMLMFWIRRGQRSAVTKCKAGIRSDVRNPFAFP